MNQLITAFNAGEVSPLIHGRVDMPALGRACRIARGFILGVAGGAFRRPPLLHVSLMGTGPMLPLQTARLIPFNRSAGESYQLEVGDSYLKVWNADGSALAATLTSPWPSARLDGLQFIQSNDVMWIVEPHQPVQELQRTTLGWTLNEIPWKYPPLRDENLTAITLTADGLTGTVNVDASAPLFDAAMTGGYFEISHFRDAVTAELQVAIIPAASAELPFTVLPVADTTFSINGTVYTCKLAANVSGPGMVEIDDTGSTAAEKIQFSRDNAIAAINAVARTTSVKGFGIGTAPNPDVSAENGGDSATSNKATGTLTCDGSNKFTTGSNSRFTIGTITYRAEAGTMSNVGPSLFDFRYGADEQTTLGNLVKAINANGVAGTDYATGMVANPDVTAALATSAVTLTAKAGGDGSGVATTYANTGGHQSFGETTLKGGTSTPTYKLKVVAKTLGDPGNLITVADTAATDHWNATSGKLSGGKYLGTTAEPLLSPEIRIKGQWDFTTYGRWAGTVYVEQKNAAGAWDVLRRVIGRLDTNRTLSGIVEGEQVLRIRVENMAGKEALDVPAPRFLLEAVEAQVHGLVKITTVVHSQRAEVLVINAIYSTAATQNWREGAFSNYRGHPAVVCLHEQRLIFAGNASEPQKLWASVTGDFRNFEQTGFDDGSWQYQLATQEGNAIRWVASQTGLIIGTAGDEWLMEGGERGITPTNAQAKRQSAYGSDTIQPILAGSVVLFVQRGGLALLEYVFDYQNAGYVAPELTELVEHLTRQGLRAIALQRAPWQIIWAVTTDGNLLACTYVRKAEVIAWAPQPVDGTVESVSVVYGTRGLADEVWIIVKRGGVRRLERFAPDHWQRLHAGGTVYHMDAAKVGDGTGLSHLNGVEVQVMADGIEQAPQVVSGGIVTVAGAVEIIAGLAQPDSTLQPMIYDIPQRTGTSQGRQYHVPEISVRFYQTRACSYADAPGREVFDIIFRDSEAPLEDPPPLFTGMKKVSVLASFRDSPDTTLIGSGIHPLNILAAIPQLQIYG